jgi:hypothetical protein
MDFGKLLAQREAKAAAVDPPAPEVKPAAPAQPKRKPRETPANSKRRDWKLCGWYVRTETKARLDAFLSRKQLTGKQIVADQSEAVDLALRAWLDKAEKRLGAYLLNRPFRDGLVPNSRRVSRRTSPGSAAIAAPLQQLGSPMSGLPHTPANAVRLTGAELTRDAKAGSP